MGAPENGPDGKQPPRKRGKAAPSAAAPGSMETPSAPEVTPVKKPRAARKKTAKPSAGARAGSGPVLEPELPPGDARVPRTLEAAARLSINEGDGPPVGPHEAFANRGGRHTKLTESLAAEFVFILYSRAISIPKVCRILNITHRTYKNWRGKYVKRERAAGVKDGLYTQFRRAVDRARDRLLSKLRWQKKQLAEGADIPGNFLALEALENKLFPETAEEVTTYIVEEITSIKAAIREAVEDDDLYYKIVEAIHNRKRSA